MPTLETIGRYQIIGEIGRGAMGVVYRAVDPNIGRAVALKTMRLDVSGIGEEELLLRFKNEARAAGLMSHPNIVTIHDADESAGLFYIAMEYLEGETLESVIVRRNVIPADEIVGVAKQVAAGLDYAHAMKVIHRDIKPANIMIMRQNAAKIMDFGISKSADTMTRGTQVLGTPNYMSPEQVRGLVLDGRSDLFSFGVVLYEMATGKRPFAGDSVTAIIYKILHEDPTPPSDLEVSVHPGLSRVISRCLAKNPNERYQSGAELTHDLENFRSAGSPDDATSVLPFSIPDTETQVVPTAPAPFPAATITDQSAGWEGVATAASKPEAPEETLALNRKREIAALSPTVRNIADVNKKTGLWVTAAALVLAAASATLFTAHHSSNAQPLQMTSQTQPLADAGTTASERPVESGSSKSERKDLPTEPVPSAVPEHGKSLPSHRTVVIRFTSNPAGALVRIDGHSNPEWATPFSASDLTPGTHEVVFTKQGYTTETRTLEIGPKNDTYPIELVPVATAILVSSDPPGANIEIDGQDTGKVTPVQVPVLEGQHTVVMRMSGYHPAQARATVESGQIYNLPQRLNPIDVRGMENPNPGETRQGNALEASLPVGQGIIDFVTFPRGANIFIEGRRANQATPAHNRFPAGDYNVELRMPGYKPVQQIVHVDAGKTSRIDVNLDPQ